MTFKEFLTKALEAIKKVLKVIGKFLKYTYAAQLTIGAFGAYKVIVGILLGKGWPVLVGLLIIAWAGLLAFNEYKQNKVSPTSP